MPAYAEKIDLYYFKIKNFNTKVIKKNKVMERKSLKWQIVISGFFLTLSWAQPSLEWRSIGMGGGGWFTTIAIDTLNPGTVYVGSDVGGFYKSTDYGASWRILNKGLIDYYVEKIVSDPERTGVIYLGTWGGVHKSTDGGETWVPKRNGFPAPSRTNYTAPIGALAVDPNNPNIIYAGIGMPRVMYNDPLWIQVPTRGAVFKSTDYGENWEMLRGTTGIDTTALFYSLAVDPHNSNIVFAGTHLGVYRSNDAGLTWELKNSGLPPMPESVVVREIAIDPAEPGRIYVATSPIKDIERNPICSGIWYTTDYGELWQPCTTGAWRINFRRIVVNPKNPSVLYAGALYGYGGRGGVYKSTNRGQTWVRITNDTNVQKGWIYFWGYTPDGLALDSRDTAKIFYCNSHAVMKSTDAGNSWIYCYSESLGNGNWRGTGLEVTCINQIIPDPIDSNIIYITLNDIGLLKSTDRGTSFQYIFEPLRPYGNTTYSLAIHPASHNIIYAGTGPWTWVYGKLWRSTDAGQTWTMLSGLPDTGYKSTILIDPNSREDSTVLYVWVSRYGVYKSTDGGETWQRKDNGLNITIRSDSFTHSHPQMLAMALNDPNTLYLCLPKRRKIYKTINGGDSWFELPLPRLLETWGVAVSPLNGAVFLMARASRFGGVYRSFDGGITWDSLPRFQIDGYRPGVRTIAFNPFDTNLVALGTLDWAIHDSCTGWGVYLSTDQGETWFEANEGLGNLRAYYLTFDPHNPQLLYLGTSGNGVFVGSLGMTGTDEAKFKGKRAPRLAITPSVVNHQTRISFTLYRSADVNLAIYDALGRKVNNLCNQYLGPGRYEFPWQGDSQNGCPVNNGVYFLVLDTGSEVLREKLTLSR